jgi:hypothetical protein
MHGTGADQGGDQYSDTLAHRPMYLAARCAVICKVLFHFYSSDTTAKAV